MPADYQRIFERCTIEGAFRPAKIIIDKYHYKIKVINGLITCVHGNTDEQFAIFHYAVTSPNVFLRTKYKVQLIFAIYNSNKRDYLEYLKPDSEDWCEAFRLAAIDENKDMELLAWIFHEIVQIFFVGLNDLLLVCRRSKDSLVITEIAVELLKKYDYRSCIDGRVRYAFDVRLKNCRAAANK